MANGFGAGFFALSLLVGLSALAVLLGATAIIGLASRRESGGIPDPVRYGAVGLLGLGVVVAGFGVLAMVDEAAVVAWLLVAVVFVPTAAAVVVGRGRSGTAHWLDHLALASMAWSGPFIAGAITFFGFVIGFPRVWNFAPAEPRGFGMAWLAVIAAGGVTLGGTLGVLWWLGGRIPPPRNP